MRVNKYRWARKHKYFSERFGSLYFSQGNSVIVCSQQAFKMGGFGLDTKYGPSLQKNGGFLIMLVEHLSSLQFSSVAHFRKR
jgi:hypothetical protein